MPPPLAAARLSLSAGLDPYETYRAEVVAVCAEG